MASKPVDTAIVMVVGPCIDSGDFVSLEEAIAYNAAGMDISLIVEKTDGTTAVTAITLTTGGTSDWTHTDGGYYSVEITAAQNIEEGVGYLRGVCTGVLPFESPRYDIVVANVYDSLIKGTDALQTDVTQISGDSTSADNMELDYDGTGYSKANSTIGTCTTNTDMVGTDSAALAATALTNVTWTDARAGVLTDWIDGGRLDNILDARAPSAEYDSQFEDVRAILGDGGDIFYVSKTGDNSDGTTWAKGMTTIDAAVALCTANHCDRIYVGCGTYDETSATNGVACDVAGIKIIGAMPGVVVNNTNTTNGSKVFYISADDVWLQNLFVEKGETISDNAICIDVDGSYISSDIRDVTVAVEKANHTGIRFTGGAVGCGYVNGPLSMSYIYSVAGVGTGMEAANCNNCVAIDAQFHTLDTGIKFTGGANSHDNMISPHAMISSCTTGITLNAGCINNMLSALVLNCTDGYDDNSGNNTNKTDGSMTYILDDIKTHVQNGFDSTQGAGFVEVDDSLEALRNRGDAAWVTATGFSTATALTTHDGKLDTVDGIVDAIVVDTAEIGVAGAGLTDLGGMSTNMKSDVNTEVADVMTVDTMSEPPQGPPPSTPTFEQMFAYMYFRMMNKNEETATEHSVYDVAGTTKVIKAAVSDSAGVLTKSAFISGA